MNPRWDFGDAVRVIRNVRNDGTFPGLNPGELLVRRGSIGHVRNVGTYAKRGDEHLMDETMAILDFFEARAKQVAS